MVQAFVVSAAEHRGSEDDMPRRPVVQHDESLITFCFVQFFFHPFLSARPLRDTYSCLMFHIFPFLLLCSYFSVWFQLLSCFACSCAAKALRCTQLKPQSNKHFTEYGGKEKVTSCFFQRSPHLCRWHLVIHFSVFVFFLLRLIVYISRRMTQSPRLNA